MIHIEKKDANGTPIPPPAPLVCTSARNKQQHYCNHPNVRATKSHYNDTRTVNVLKAIYNNKCGYCEQLIRWVGDTPGSPRPQDANSIEHYRPKKPNMYNWLAYSWDNLFLACIGCNNPKGHDFPINGTQITQARAGDLANIHSLTSTYNSIEQPKYPHPEVDFPEHHLEYSLDGKVSSSHPDYDYFIRKCELNDREELVSARKKIYEEEFELEFLLILADTDTSVEEKNEEIIDLIEAFEMATEEETLPFLGCRRYIYRTIVEPIKEHYQ